MISVVTMGAPSVVVDGEAVRIPTRKHFAAFVYLAVNAGRPISREQLAHLLWGDSSDQRARHSLSQALYGLTISIPRLELVRNSQDVTVSHDALEVDLLTFRELVRGGRLQEAAEIPGGGFLDGFWVPGAEAFAEWQEDVAGHVRLEVLDVMTRLLDRAEQEADWANVGRYAGRIRSIDPYNEAAVRGLIRATALKRGPGAAIAEFRRFQTLLERDLGESPSEETAKLAATIRRGEIRPPPRRGQDPHLLQFPLVGRASEFKLICEEWDEVQKGRGGATFILGEAGIGKSRLCDHFLQYAQSRGARTLHGKCYASERRVAYSGVAEALRTGLRWTDVAKISPIWRASVSQLVPEIIQGAAIADLPDLVHEGARRRLFEAVAQTINEMARESNVILFLDDFHWSDESTCAITHYLVRRLADSRVMFLIALRPEDVAGDSAAWEFLAESSHSMRVKRVTLNNLSRDAVHRLLDAFQQNSHIQLLPSQRESVERYTGGRPFFLVELLKALGESVKGGKLHQSGRPGQSQLSAIPPSLEAFLDARFKCLTSGAGALLEAAAVVGQSESLVLLGEMIDSDVGEVLECANELVRHGLLQVESGIARYQHDLIREATYRSIPDFRRRDLHRKAAEVLRTRPTTPSSVLAVHYDQAGLRSEAYQYGIAAAQESADVYANSETEHYVRLALSNAPDAESRFRLQRRLAEFLYRARRFADAESLYVDLVRQCQARDVEDTQLLQLEVRLANIAATRSSDSVEAMLERIVHLLERAERYRDDESALSLLRVRALVAHNSGDQVIVQESVRALLRLAKLATDQVTRATALRLASNFLSNYSDTRRGLLCARKAVRIAEGIRDRELLIAALGNRGSAEYCHGLLAGARETLTHALRLCDEVGAIQQRVEVLNNVGVVYLEQGEYAPARACFVEILDLADEIDVPQEVALARCNLAMVHLELCEFESLHQQCRELLSAHRARPAWWSVAFAYAALGTVALHRGQVSEARKYRREVNQKLHGTNYWIVDCSVVETFLARLATNDGRTARARNRLNRAIRSYKNRDVLCRSRLEVEWARLSVEEDPAAAGRVAQRVRDRAARMGARPLVDKAERVLDRLNYGTRSVGALA